MSEIDVELIRRKDNSFVPAKLYDGLVPEDLLLVEREWNPIRQQLLQNLLRSNAPLSMRPESLHWDWSKKAPELRLLEATGFAIVCEDAWQGVMLTKTASYFSQSTKDRGKPLVYIDYLEAAPWNWNLPPIDQQGKYKGIGSILFRAAVCQSFDEGFKGRVGLHSLPQSENFYKQACGMIEFEKDVRKQNLLYFELSQDRAEAFLDEGGTK